VVAFGCFLDPRSAEKTPRGSDGERDKQSAPVAAFANLQTNPHHGHVYRPPYYRWRALCRNAADRLVADCGRDGPGLLRLGQLDPRQYRRQARAAGYTWALLHHMLGGLRHFMWDLGYGFDKEFSTKLAMANIIGSLCLTVLVWVIGFIIRF
jgi:hypothetical protein